MRPIEIASRLMNIPVGVRGAHRPLAIPGLRGRGSVADAISGRVVVVTGASSGIGEAAASRLAAAGAEVVLVARRERELAALAARIEADGGVAHPHPCDLADADAAEALGREVVERHGAVEVLVNNAGRSIRRSIELSYDRAHDFERTMALNYMGAVRMILAFLPGMRERGHGQIVNVSTAGVNTKVPRFSAYIASKAALDAFSECIQAEIGDDGVRVTTIHMPLVRTPMIAPTRSYRGVPSISPEQAADWIAEAIAHRPARVGTPYSEAAAMLNAVSPASMDWMRRAGYRRTRDSGAAGRDGEGA
ncbi:MAG TPA: SDR family NAD(P)-dependent oxidoreductase [Solirubrobacterales bacterium]